ncbi:ABC transporter permease [Vagococcus carniphilus]|uniref:ABC transporter permease n=1 Tax=Vagococcus carniphilus TaxID=218144 RepID=UPI0028926A16|nr:ABC transporter permease [Vagococcus carniphilus]MDT2848037.1 ABC transporter permease [Vagococcus carniphilus]
MERLIKSEFQKIKRKGFWFLSFLGAFGVVSLQALNYGVRKDWLLQQNPDYWEYFLLNVTSYIPIAIVLGTIILSTQISSIEEETNAWKMQIALPISKKSLYAAKFFVVLFFLIVACVLLVLFTLFLGLFLNFNQPIPVLAIIKQSFLPFLAVLPIASFQLWIAVIAKTQATPITIGVLNFLLTYSSQSLPDWTPWSWTSLPNPLINSLLGIGVGLLIFFIGQQDFYRKDVK